MRRATLILAAVVALTGSYARGAKLSDVKPEELLSLDYLDDEDSLRFYADYYVSWHGLGKFKGRNLDKKLVPAFERLERLFAESSVDFVPVLIQSLREVGYGRPDGTKAGPYFNMNLRAQYRDGRTYPKRVLDLLATHALQEHALDFAYLLDCQDLGIVEWAGGQILRLGGEEAASEVARLLRERLAAHDDRFAKLGALAVYFKFDRDASVVTGALGDSDWMVRVHALRALGAARIKSTEPSIRRMLVDPDLDVRLEAQRALLHLEGKEIPFPAPWRAK